MKNPKRKRTLRTMLLSALLIAAISGMTVFFAVNASEATEQPAEVTSSDSAEAEEVFSEEVTVRTTQVVISEVVGAKHYRFKPDASYNGSFRSELIANELPIYDALYAEYVTNKSNGTVQVDVSSMGYSKDKMNEVSDLVLSAYAAFTMDHPEVYWVDGYSSSIWMQGSNIVQVDITASERYSDAYSQLSTVESGISSAVSAISASRASGSRYDTAKAIHDYICNQMAYDYDAANTGNYGEAHCMAPLFGGGSRGKQFVCEGYANAFKLLCDKFGVPAVHVKGDAVTSSGTGGHSWNYVQMEDGKWYGVDSTWDDQSTLMHTYFLVGSGSAVFNGKTFSQDHLPGNQVMSGDTVYPLAYPDLATETYVPGATVPATGITLSKTSLSLTKGGSATLTATVTPSNSTDSVVWTSSNTSVATVSNGTVTAVGNGSATITATAGSKSATCSVTVTEAASETYDVTPNINGGASKLYEPWGLRYFAAFNGEDTDKITDRGIAILKETYYSSGMTPAQFCANPNVHIFLDSRDELAFEQATSANPNGRYIATLTEGIYSYDISAKYYVVPFAVMNNGQTIYGAIKSNSMENILKANLNLSTITQTEKNICTCILELKNSVAAHYEAVGVPGALVDMNIPRGSSQSSATVRSAAETGITANVVGGASRLIEPWGLRYFATFTASDDIVERGMVMLCEKYYQSSYSSSPDSMRLNANAYVFRDSDGTLQIQSETGRYYSTVTEGISSKDIADTYYVVPFAVLSDGSYVYGTVKSNSMMKIMRANLNSSAVPATERAVSEDIIDLYNAVKAYYE